MEDIKMTATKAQYAKLKAELDAAFLAVMEQMGNRDGKTVRELASEVENYLQVAQAAPCATGPDALQLAFQALQLPPGAEVILPAFASGEVADGILKAGLQPVFADVNKDTFTLCPASAERMVSAKTAAILPVHLFGQCAQMKELTALAAKYNLSVIEDASQALGAIYVWDDGKEQRAGSLGHTAYTSFFPGKPLLDSGEGAAALANQQEAADRLRQFAGRVHQLDALEAAMLRVKVSHADAYHAPRQEIARFYNNTFAETELVQAPHTTGYSSHTYQQYAIKVPPAMRNGLKQYLYDNYIPSAIYYTEPLHLQEKYTSGLYQIGDLPVAEMLSQSLLALPMHSELKEEQLVYICQHVLTYVKQEGEVKK
ncbi:DegT/DnrJ/EryC1/StrS family aminotransferase [Pontibacter mangrovi]|uniref:Transcriptional regulator n=1 Tax=Pontibacter mangrovi TaxID=2589816 RepID=A0A501W3B5_9BACT|nr:DegT/DnrJ/EryC1/StrS family aminotransferase [Pontibacter mangrovi]TPE43252.1 transcriptional regulator [Pontibacter mangrovi]